MTKAMNKLIPKVQSNHAAPILEKVNEEKEFFFLVDGFSYKVGNHINAVPSRKRAAQDIIAVAANRCFG